MPYCTQCGQQVRDQDAFCGVCGARQHGVSPRPPFTRPLDLRFDMHSRTASMLCYIPVVGWIMAIVVLASRRFEHDRETRFHAFQGLYLFVAWLIVDWVVGPVFRAASFGWSGIPPVAGILKAVIFAAWIFMIIKASHNEFYKLPFLGELAERSVSEQK
jgi:uncharacterized membrane protein